MVDKYDFGMIGLGVMGRNFLLNVVDHGFSAIGLDNDEDKVASLDVEGKGKRIKGTTSLKEFISHLSIPRKVMLLVPAGNPVDQVIESLLAELSPGDLIIDGGNSLFQDTERREKYLKEKQISFIGSGVSGGSEGARKGPSIMPGGELSAYEIIAPIFESVAAKVNDIPCVTHIGRGSAGNYVKMVHNGIEYGMMQMIAEIYQIMKVVFALSNEEIQSIFENWNKGRLKSFLIEITAAIFTEKDDQSNDYLVDKILDKAKQKGTGKWTSQNAMDLGIPIPTIDSSISMRAISSYKNTRKEIASLFPDDIPPIAYNEDWEQQLEGALHMAFLVAFTQGFCQIAAASKEYDYGVNLQSIATIWQGGCIIRAAMLEEIVKAFGNDKALESLLIAPEMSAAISSGNDALRKVVALAVNHRIPVMSLSASLAYYDAFSSAHLPLNLVQAQRDYFGSHTYERTDRDGIFHTDWGK